MRNQLAERFDDEDAEWTGKDTQPMMRRPTFDTLPNLYEEDEAPPMQGKVSPAEAMDSVVTTLDDEHRVYHHHPNESGHTGFGFDPTSGDAAADLAGELGTQFLESATRVDDYSARVQSAEDDEDEIPFLLEASLDEDDLEADISGGSFEVADAEERSFELRLDRDW